jgi:outer membrane protein TolC
MLEVKFWDKVRIIMHTKIYKRMITGLLFTGVSFLGSVLVAQENSFQKTPKELGLDDSGKGEIFSGPKDANTKAPTEFKKVDIQTGDVPLPINMAAALQLSDARPLIIDAAKAAEMVAAAQLQRANVLWLPNIYAGIDYFRHDGQYPSPSVPGQITNSRQAYTAGPGLSAIFATTDAIYEPLSAKQILKARQYEIQAAKNDALMEVAVAYFNVQQSRGRLAGAIDTVTKGKDLVKKTEVLSKGLAAPVEIDRSRTLLAELEENAVKARNDWKVASAELARLLRLNPMAQVVPVEPPHLAMMLISPSQPVDALISLGLTSRPELSSNQALVQATLVKLKQEKMRPFIPSLILQGNSGANGNSAPLLGGVTSAGVNGQFTPGSRFDMNAAALWELKNFGFGNRALIRDREGHRQQALVDLFMVQDKVAAEVAQTQAQLLSASERVVFADAGLKNALINYDGNLKGMSETTRFGDVLMLVNRPQEVVASLQQLDNAYRNYFVSVQDYNRSQFKLFRAVGYPAEVLAIQKTPGKPIEVDTIRPFDLPPVTGIPYANMSYNTTTDIMPVKN